MANMMSRLADLRVMSQELVAEARVWRTQESRERNGRASVQLVGQLRLLAIAAYKLDHDIPAFREGLRECGELYVRLFERLNAGEPISESYLSMITYQNLFNALAAGDFELSLRFATLMGGREAIEAYHDSDFGRAFGYALKYLVEDRPELVAPRVADLVQICRDDRRAPLYAGYATVFQAMLDHSLPAAQAGFKEIVSGHQRLIKGGRHFHNTPDEVLCVWGIGMANLARARGLAVEPDNDWIPADLLVPVSASAS